MPTNLILTASGEYSRGVAFPGDGRNPEKFYFPKMYNQGEYYKNWDTGSPYL